jgi:hypothetical protein
VGKTKREQRRTATKPRSAAPSFHVRFSAAWSTNTEPAPPSVERAIADFPLDGRERFIPSPFKIALGRTWHPAFSPSTLAEKFGPVVREWARFERVLGTLRSFAARRDFIGEWARAELQAVDAALAGEALALKAGDPLRETLQAGTDHWLVNAFEHLTGKGLTPRQAYRELARIRHTGVQATEQKFSRLRDEADRRLRENADMVRAAAAFGWTSGLEACEGMKRRTFVERTRRILRRKKV